MVLKLVGVPMFSHTQLVAVTLIEKKVPFEVETVSLEAGDNKKPDYLEKHPFGQTPYIDDDGFILYESRAIARYLEAKYPNQGAKLIPDGLKEKALFEQAASVELNNFNPYAMTAVHEKLVNEYLHKPVDQAIFDKNIKSLSEKLDVYDKILSKQNYLAGNEFTLADLFHLPYSSLLSIAGSDIMTTKPYVARWFNDITSRPSWHAVREGKFESILSY